MRTGRGAERGSAILMAVVVTLVIVFVAAALLTLVGANSQLSLTESQGLHALYAADTAAAIALAAVRGNPGALADLAGDDGIIAPGDAPFTRGFIGTAAYNVTITLWGRDGVDNDNVDNDPSTGIDDVPEQRFVTITAQGYIPGDTILRTWAQVQSEARLVTRVTEVIVAQGKPGPLEPVTNMQGNAAANGQPTFEAYTAQGASAPFDLRLGGTGASADQLVGDVFVNGNVTLSGSANIQGGAMITGRVTDNSTTWTNNSVYDIAAAFNFAGANYRTNHDVNVNQLLTVGRSDVSQGVGNPALSGESGTAAQGSATQILNKNNPAHIFRREPSDRKETNTPGVPTFYLEDPTHAIRNDPNWNGTDASILELSPGFSENVVYYVKGDLWLHNQSAYSYKVKPPPGQPRVRIVIVVEGNINIGDNFFYNDNDKDAVAFIAMKDPARPDSGNINIGDAIHGTTEQMRGYWVAENNVNIRDLSHSSATLINGNFYAGNRLTQTAAAESAKLSIVGDTRLAAGLLDGWDDLLPPSYEPAGAAGSSEGGVEVFAIRSWRQQPPKASAATTGAVFTPPAP